MASAISDSILLGAVTGMRSMSGLTAAALAHRRWWAPIAAAAAVAEMIADKTPFAGDRIDPLPLAGRAVLGGVVGALVARGPGDNRMRGAIAGATAAVVCAHLSYRARVYLPASTITTGFLEDAFVVALGSLARSGSEGMVGNPRRPFGDESAWA